MKIKLNVRPTNSVYEAVKKAVSLELVHCEASVMVDNGVMYVECQAHVEDVKRFIASNSY